MNVDLGIWDRLTRIVIFLLLIAGLLGVGVWYLPVIKKNERMRKKIMELDMQLEKSEETARQAKASIDALRYDLKAVERLSRERLGYARPDEIVVRFEPPATNHAVPH